MRKRDVEINQHYMIVEGEGKEQVGVCVGRKESSFGRIWADVRLRDGTVITKRISDLRSEDELTTQLREKSANGSQAVTSTP